MAGRVLAVVADQDSHITKVFDGDSGKMVGKRIRYAHHLTASTVLLLEGRRVVLSVTSDPGEDGFFLERHDLATGRRLTPAKRLSRTNADVQLCRVRESAVVVWHQENDVRLVDAVTFKEVTKPFRAKGDVTFAKIVRLGDEDVVVVAAQTTKDLHWIQGWRLRDRKRAFEPIAIGDSRPRALTAGTLNGRTVVGVGRPSGLELWLADGRRVLEIDLDARVNGLVLVPPSRIIASSNKGLVAIDWHG